jgi:hypothetical protein
MLHILDPRFLREMDSHDVASIIFQSLGYGDVPIVSTVERLFVTVGMIVGTCVFTYLIGAVTGIMAGTDG